MAGIPTIRSVLPYPAGPYPDGTTEIFVRIALFERTPISLIGHLVAVADVALPAPVVQLIPPAPVTLAALLVCLIALTPTLTWLPLDSLVVFLALAHAVPSTGERSHFDCHQGFYANPMPRRDDGIHGLKLRVARAEPVG